MVNTALPVTSGSTLYVDVGQPGPNGPTEVGGAFDGGGGFVFCAHGKCASGGGGGGSSAVLTAPRATATLTGDPTTDSRLLVAGGGGGGGSAFPSGFWW